MIRGWVIFKRAQVGQIYAGVDTACLCRRGAPTPLQPRTRFPLTWLDAGILRLHRPVSSHEELPQARGSGPTHSEHALQTHKGHIILGPGFCV